MRICILCQQSDPYNKIRKTLVKKISNNKINNNINKIFYKNF
ncbi:hypothetical protein ANHYDRO_00968 [Anaerococcus hydrogenalis DSM 7454]|uniref:Uncharacterized protein n=1 Tax=Anaerococcus hydrogenalis DSM 7454 TaxID=561177 RepID=B6W8R7_9FIRM|nr:hypothetical protein ANHYDRO_00968 [Anaerococcus hydrogenalis DSM 7454]